MMSPNEVSLKTCSGQEVSPYIDSLTQLRIRVFREYPYLYHGTEAYERKYLARYATCPRCIFALAIDNSEVVGVSTGLPLADECEEFQRPFLQANIPVKDVFYFGESVLLPNYRGQGIGHRFFDEREAHAQRIGPYPITTFCAVERPEDHPLRPADYRPHDAFWTKRGYTRQPQLHTSFSWLDVGQSQETDKPMVYWTRQWQ